MFILAELTNFIGYLVFKFIFRKDVELGDYRRTEWKFMMTGIGTLIIIGYLLGVFL